MWRRVLSLVLIGAGLACFVPPIYVTIADWRGLPYELAWTHLADKLPVCSAVALVCFYCAWRVRRRLRERA